MDRTQRAVLDQTRAMGASLFEVGVFDAKANRMLLRTWDTESLTKSLPWLKHQNAQGSNIYIRPAGEHGLSMVDDLSKSSIDWMKREGYQPAAVVETSPGNYQAWLNHGKTLGKEASTLAARELAGRFGGDMKAADWRHFGRLTGFTNQKPIHRQENGLQPFCKLIESSGQVYDQAPHLVRDVAQKHEAAKRQMEETRAIQSAMPQHSATKTIDDFRKDLRYGSDMHRADQAYSLYAVSHGVPKDQIAADIASRDLSKKGPPQRQQQYIDNTLAKALKMAGLER